MQWRGQIGKGRAVPDFKAERHDPRDGRSGIAGIREAGHADIAEERRLGPLEAVPVIAVVGVGLRCGEVDRLILDGSGRVDDEGPDLDHFLLIPIAFPECGVGNDHVADP